MTNEKNKVEKTKEKEKQKEKTTQEKIMSIAQALRTMNVRYATVSNISGYLLGCAIHVHSTDGVLNQEEFLNGIKEYISKHEIVKEKPIGKIPKLDL